MIDYRAQAGRVIKASKLRTVHQFWLRSQAEACRINVVIPFGSECRADGVFATCRSAPSCARSIPRTGVS